MNVRKPFITVLGWLVILAGLVMLVIPGPGLVAIAAGLAILGTEYHWARRLLKRVRDRIERLQRKKDTSPDK